MSGQKIRIVENGPYLVSGGVKLTQEIMEDAGGHREYHHGVDLPQAEDYALCRCGNSKDMPFCDGTHVEVGFLGTEIAGRAPFDERAKCIEGPTLDLYDDERCAYARFCHREDGDVWDLTERSDDERLRGEAILAAVECPAGRLVQHDKLRNHEAIEPEFPDMEISILEDPAKDCSACLYVKGGVPLESADGTLYEKRNRYALCRCGGSQNKPFCDAMHVNLGFKDGIG